MTFGFIMLLSDILDDNSEYDDLIDFAMNRLHLFWHSRKSSTRSKWAKLMLDSDLRVTLSAFNNDNSLFSTR